MSVWDQQENESVKAYEAFCGYRDLGTSRSVDAAFNQARQTCGKPAAKRADGWWWQWAAEYDWKRRAEAYDAYLELKARLEREDIHRQELTAYRERARKTASAAAEIAVAALTKAGRRLSTLDPDHIEPGMLPAYLRAAADVFDKSLSAEAEAIGVRRLEILLDGNHPATEGTGMGNGGFAANAASSVPGSERQRIPIEHYADTTSTAPRGTDADKE